MLNRRHWLSLAGLKAAIVGFGRYQVTRQRFRGRSDAASAACSGILKVDPATPADFALAQELRRVDPVSPLSTGRSSALDNVQTARCGQGPCGIAKEFGESGPVIGTPGTQVKEFLDDDDDGAESRRWIVSCITSLVMLTWLKPSSMKLA